MHLTDNQFNALHYMVEHGPIVGEDVAIPVGMCGKRKTKFVCHVFTGATVNALCALGLATVTLGEVRRPVDAAGRHGHPRRTVTVTITDAGRRMVAQ
jgi:hypothetical protein